MLFYSSIFSFTNYQINNLAISFHARQSLSNIIEWEYIYRDLTPDEIKFEKYNRLDAEHEI